MSDERIERTAQYFYHAHRNGEHYARVPDAYRPANLDQAYAAQARFVELLSDHPRSVAGYKIAVTSQVIQQLVGLDHPCLGVIRSGLVHSAPAVLPRSNFYHPAVECEIAFKLKDDLAPLADGHDRETVTEAVESCHTAFEIIDDRYADYSTMDAFSLIADNCWCAGVVLGPAITNWQSLPLDRLTGTLRINQKTAGQGVTRDALGHPLEGLAWIANRLARQEQCLRAGMVVITGSIIATEFLEAGDNAVFAVDHLEETALALT